MIVIMASGDPYNPTQLLISDITCEKKSRVFTLYPENGLHE